MPSVSNMCGRLKVGCVIGAAVVGSLAMKYLAPMGGLGGDGLADQRPVLSKSNI